MGPKTYSIPQLRKQLEANTPKVYPGEPLDTPRPSTRSECKDGPRPCPYVSCRHHLYLDVNPHNGSIKFNFPDKEVWELEQTCSLDVAEEGGVELHVVGDLVGGISYQAVRSFISKRFPLLRDALSGFGPDDTNTGSRQVTDQEYRNERMLAAWKSGRTQREMAEEFSVSSTTAGDVVRRRLEDMSAEDREGAFRERNESLINERATLRQKLDREADKQQALQAKIDSLERDIKVQREILHKERSRAEKAERKLEQAESKVQKWAASPIEDEDHEAVRALSDAHGKGDKEAIDGLIKAVSHLEELLQVQAEVFDRKLAMLESERALERAMELADRALVKARGEGLADQPDNVVGGVDFSC